MPHRIHKCTNTLYDYGIINYLYLCYFKKIGKVFTSKFVRTGPSSYKKRILPGRGLTKVEKHWPIFCMKLAVKCVSSCKCSSLVYSLDGVTYVSVKLSPADES